MRASERQRLTLQTWASEHAWTPDSPEPENWPAEAKLETHGLRPLSHGDHAIGQSGVYAAVNGLRLVCAGHQVWSARSEQQMFGAAWDWQQSRREGRLDRGMRISSWCRMVDALSFAHSRKHGAFIKVTRPWSARSPDRQEFFTTIERLIISQHAVLSMLAGARYSVIRGYTPVSLLLFDSGHRQSVRRASTDLGGSVVAARHRIVPTATLALARLI
jgi:hypothetical protein